MKKRKDGNYQSQITVLEHGIKKQKYFYGKSQAEVRRKILEYKGSSAQGSKFCIIAEEWRDVHEKEIAYYTAECYKAPLKDVLSEFGEKYINEITPSQIQNFILKLCKQNKARQTVKLRLVTLNLILKHAMLQGECTTNPAEYVSLPRGLTSKKRETASEESIEKIKEHADDSRWLLPLFLLYTGCRRSEALAISYEDIDFNNNLIYVSKRVEFHGEEPLIVEKTKTSSSKRKIILMNALKKHLDRTAKGYLFQGKFGLLKKYELRDIWDTYAMGITLHQLRHAYTTMLYEAGIDPEVAMTQTGHSNISTMRNIYTHIRTQQLKKAENALNDFTEK